MHRLRVRAGAAAFIASAAALAVLLAPSHGVQAAQQANVQIVTADPANGCPANATQPPGYCYQPRVVTISPGGTVKWTNPSAVQHTVTRCRPMDCAGQDGGSGSDPGFGSIAQIAPAGVYSFSFSSAGTYYYYSTDDRYDAMRGEVIVTAAASPTPVQLSPGAGSQPSATPTPMPTPTDTPSPSPSPTDTPSPVADTSPSPDTSPTPSDSFPIGAVGDSGGGSALVPIVLILLALGAVGGGVFAYRLYARSR